MISCVITTLKVNVYQRKSDLLRIDFIISCQLIKKNQIMRQRVPDLQSAYYYIMGIFLSIHVMKVAGISPFNHLKCINGWRCEFPLSRYCINYKMQRKKWYSGQMPAVKNHRKACLMILVRLSWKV